MALYGMNSMKLVAILATYNEERFVANCVRNLVGQGALIYLIDNESTDETIRHVRETAGNALVGVESFPRHGIYSWQPILERISGATRPWLRYIRLGSEQPAQSFW